jgi:hypothetical protein
MVRICVSCLADPEELPSGDNDNTSSEDDTILVDEEAGSHASGGEPEDVLETSTNHPSSTTPDLRLVRLVSSGKIMTRDEACGVDDAWRTDLTTPPGSLPGDPLGLGSVFAISPVVPGKLI